MPHFVCKGECNGLSEEPGLCQADMTTCTKAGTPLDPCSCDDNMHGKETPAEASQDSVE